MSAPTIETGRAGGPPVLAPALAHQLLHASSHPFEILVVEDELPEGNPATLPDPSSDPHAVRWLYSTSGTTAVPKIVRHSDATLIAGGTGIAVAMEPEPDDVS